MTKETNAATANRRSTRNSHASPLEDVTNRAGVNALLPVPTPTEPEKDIIPTSTPRTNARGVVKKRIGTFGRLDRAVSTTLKEEPSLRVKKRSLPVRGYDRARKIGPQKRKLDVAIGENGSTAGIPDVDSESDGDAEESNSGSESGPEPESNIAPTPMPARTLRSRIFSSPGQDQDELALETPKTKTRQSKKDPAPFSIETASIEREQPTSEGTIRPVFCCSCSYRGDPKCLYNCDPMTCLQRGAILHLAKDLGTFAYLIPFATSSLLEQRDYMIQVIKYIPSDNQTMMSTSRIRSAANAASLAQNEGRKQWKIDLENAGPYGRFFVQSDTGEQDEMGNVLRYDDESIWAEVQNMGVGEEGTQRLHGYRRMEESAVDFECDYHKEEKWVCFYWVKTTSA